MHIYDKHGNTLHSLSAGEDVIIFKKGIIAPKAEHTFGNPNVILGNILAATDTSALFMQWNTSAPTHRIPVGNANTNARTLLYPLTDQERPYGLESIQTCGKNHRYRDIMEAYDWVKHYLTVSPVYSSTQMQKKLSDGAYKSNLNFSTEEQLKESLCNALESVITLTTSLFQAAKSEALEANAKALNAVNNRYTVAMHNFTALEADTERHFLHERLLVATGDILRLHLPGGIIHYAQVTGFTKKGDGVYQVHLMYGNGDAGSIMHTRDRVINGYILEGVEAAITAESIDVLPLDSIQQAENWASKAEWRKVGENSRESIIAAYENNTATPEVFKAPLREIHLYPNPYEVDRHYDMEDMLEEVLLENFYAEGEGYQAYRKAVETLTNIIAHIKTC